MLKNIGINFELCSLYLGIFYLPCVFIITLGINARLINLSWLSISPVAIFNALGGLCIICPILGVISGIIGIFDGISQRKNIILSVIGIVLNISGFIIICMVVKLATSDN